MHGSVCLFSKYLKHLLEGENLDELDISSRTSSLFKNAKTLSTGWTGTCPVLQSFNSIQNDFSNELTSLDSMFSSYHQNTMSLYKSTSSLIDDLFIISKINVTLPSKSSKTLIPKFENEFSDKNNKSLIGGEINYNFNNKLKPFIDQDGTIQTQVNSLLNSNSFKTKIDDTYSNIAKFDTAVATAANVMNNRILDLKDYFLTLQFLLMFFTWGYLLFYVALGVLYVIYACKGYEILFYIMLVLVNLLFLMILVEIFLSSFFGQVRLICHEVPRAMHFVFTGNYMVSGNSASYPATFGRGDANMTKMFTTCLNGDGNLINLFINSNDLSSFTALKNQASNLYVNFNEQLSLSNLVLNNYNSLDNSIFLKSIVKLELMKDNLYMATEGFEEDDIYKILYNIRTNLDSNNCSLTNEYYVIKESDCPSGSRILKTIYNSTNEKHCYLIQNLTSGVTASYLGSCDNEYINNAIAYIKQIDSLLDNRLAKIKSLQTNYASTYKNLYNEIYSTSEKLNNSYYILNNNLLKISNISNCGSVRYDLIDFCDFIGDTTEYDARIVVIFSAFLGVFGFVLLYSFLVVLNGFRETENDDNDDFGYNYGKNKKIRNFNIKVNKSKLNNKDSNDYGEENEEDDDNYKKSFKKNNAKKPPKSGQKVEMSYISKNNNEDSDSD